MRDPISRATAITLLALLSACDGDGGGEPLGPVGSEVELSLSGLAELDPTREGVYQAWMVDGSGTAHSAGRFQSAAAPVRVTTPIADAAEIWITVEPPGDTDAVPSPHLLLRGRVSGGGSAELGVEGALTAADLPLREKPGQYTVFTPSDNFEHGYPSNEHAGIWLLNSTVVSQGLDQWVRLTPLKPGWVYEGWAVRDHGLPGAVWMSYGKFTPTNDGTVSRRDHNGWGPFSGVEDYRTAGAEDYPGDDWVANPFGFPVPGDLPLPIDLRERNAAGEFRWWHVITIEPARDLEADGISEERPFAVRPYRDRFLMVFPDNRDIGRGRPITFQPDGVPGGSARVLR